MPTTVLKATGWAVVVTAIFAFSARSMPTCNGTKPSAPVECTRADTCEAHTAPCPATGTYPVTVSRSCQGGITSDHCRNKAAESSGDCQGKWICAKKSECDTLGMDCIKKVGVVALVCTNDQLKETASCNVP